VTGRIATALAADRAEAARQPRALRNDRNDYLSLVNQNQTYPRPRTVGRVTVDSGQGRLELTADRLGGAGGARLSVIEGFDRF
jgi:hypothetical protein